MAGKVPSTTAAPTESPKALTVVRNRSSSAETRCPIVVSIPAKMTAKTMSASRLVSAVAAIRLSVNSINRRWWKMAFSVWSSWSDVASAPSAAIVFSVAGSTAPMPGWIRFTITSPIVTARTVVVRY